MIEFLGRFRRNIPAGDGAYLARGFGPVDHLLCLAIIGLVTAVTYHPYFFGDEITVLRETSAASGFVEALQALSAYKPRLLFNSFWAWGATEDIPRSVFAAINAVCMAAVCSLSAVIAGRWFLAGRAQVWLLVAVLVTSRFAAILYFDYLCGIIDTMSAALILATAVTMVAALRDQKRIQLIVPVLLATATVLVHERYAAGTLALALAAAIWIWRHRRPGQRVLGLAFAATLALVPPLVFICLTRLMSVRSLSTGTAGEEIAVNVGTFKVVATYLANVLLGTNFGKDWFVGSLHAASPLGETLSWIFAALFLLLWGIYVWSLRRRPDRLEACLGVFAILAALVLVASLPGEARQEARWMYPVAILAALAVFCSPLGWVRSVLLSAMLLVSLVHWVNGSLDAIYNIHASRTARNLAQSVNGLIPAGRDALVMGMQSDTWTFGNDEGLAQFSRRNLGGKVRLRYFDPDNVADAGADTAFLRIGEQFAVVDGLALRVLGSPERVEEMRGLHAGCLMLGSGRHWSGWSWLTPPDVSEDGVILGSPLQNTGHYVVPARELDGMDLFYSARSLDTGKSSLMRLQVNWLDQQRNLLTATIRVVELGSNTETYKLPLQAPPGASLGEVYATLHDGQAGPALLEEVHVAAPVVMELAGDWEGWSWSNPPKRTSAGVILEAPAITVGTKDVSAALLDRRVVVYRARTLQNDASSTMRLQVNWNDATGRFLGTQIELAQVRDKATNSAMLINSPPGAVTGTIYANLHDGADVQVELQAISLAIPRRSGALQQERPLSSSCPVPSIDAVSSEAAH